MTSRERSLGLVLLALVGTAACLFGAQLYAERIRSLDASIAAAEAKSARLELYSRERDPSARERIPWSANDASAELFLSRFDEVLRDSGWRIESTIFAGRKEGETRFSIGVSGPSRGWDRLLAAIAAWDRPVLIESLEASAAGKGRMIARIEASYETE